MPIVEGLQQQTAAWIVARIGMVTASRMNDVMSKLKNGKESAARRDYKAEIVCEMLTGRAADHYVSPAMEWGIENERFARTAYELEVAPTEPGGYATHPTIVRFGASPDGFVGDKGLVELKCPTTAVHLAYIAAGVVPEEYHWQLLAQLACTEREFVDFVSYDLRLPEKFQLFVRRFHRDEERIKQMEDEVVAFLFEVVEQVKVLEKVKLVDVPETFGLEPVAAIEKPKVSRAVIPDWRGE